MATKKHDGEKKNDVTFDGGIGGIFKGLAGFVETLGDLADTGKVLSKTGEIHGMGKEMKGIYGFTVKVGLGDDEMHIEPFGNIRKDKKSGHSVVQEIREPVVDIFEEKNHTLIVIEMPGVTVKDVKLDIKDDLLTIYAERGDKKYSKEILLPGAYSKDKIQITSNNGIFEIKCMK